jgi:hypothetical protein
MKPENTYTITIKTLCGEETTQTLKAESPKEALNQILKFQTSRPKSDKKSVSGGWDDNKIHSEGNF